MPPLKLVNRGPAGLVSKSLVKTEESGEKKRSGRVNNISLPLKGMAVSIASLVPDPENARVHGERNMESIIDSLDQYGQLKPLVVRKKTRVVVAGNGTLAAAKELGWTKIAANLVDMDNIVATGYGIADNRTAEFASWNFQVLARLNKLLEDANHNPVGWSPEEIIALRKQVEADGQPEVETVSLSERFLVPPFSVLDARQGLLNADHGLPSKTAGA